MRSFRELLTKPNIILLSIPVLLALYVRFGMAPNFDFFFGSLIGDPTLESFLRIFYQNISIFLLLFLVPLVIIRARFREPLSAFGLTTGDKKFGYKVVFISLIPISVGLILGAAMPGLRPPSFHDLYPAIPAVAGNVWLFLLNALVLVFFYAAFEFFYRGYVLFGLKEKFGAAAAILIQAIPSVLIHFDRPDGEFFISIPAEIFFGWLALRTGSVWYGFLIHLFVGIGIELACILIV
jgi:membrane protease YdiL (CAAX protease family)